MSQVRRDVGDQVRVFVNFRNLQGQRANPTSVAAAFLSPSGVTTQVPGVDIHQDLSVDPETLAPYVGRYYYDLLLTEGSNDEPYWVRFEGTGAVQAAEEQDVWVRPPHVVIP